MEDALRFDILRWYFGCLILLLALGIFASPPGLAAAKKSKDYCKNSSGVEFVDTASRLTDAFLKKMQKVGAKIVARYYDYENETLPGKRLRDDEVKLINDYNLKLVVVFQHNNNKPQTFVDFKIRGPADAQEALKLAKKFGQPEGSAIYFGVDGDFVGHTPTSNGFYATEVSGYFEAVNKEFKNSGFRVGVYGSGATCSLLRKNGFISHCWLSHSHGFVGTPKALTDGTYDIEQYLPGDCGGRSVDFGKLRAPDNSIGEFQPSLTTN